MRFLCLIATACLSMLPGLAQEKGKPAAEDKLPGKVRALLRQPFNGRCSVAMPNPLRQSPGRLSQDRMPQFPPPEPGPFAFRELRMPAPPCDEVQRRIVPLFRDDAEPKPAPDKRPEREKER